MPLGITTSQFQINNQQNEIRRTHNLSAINATINSIDLLYAV